MERWRDIPGYEGIYQASTDGNIRTCEGKTTYTVRHGVRRWKQRVLKQKFAKNKKGRTDARVNLWKGGCEKTYLVSRLVAMAWCEGYQDGLTVNHINGNPLDNRAENLEWVTLHENIAKGFKEGLYRNQQFPVALSNEGVLFKFDSKADANRFLGRSHGYVDTCLKEHRPITSINGTRYEIVKGA